MKSIVFCESEQQLPAKLFIQQQHSGAIPDCVAEVQTPSTLSGKPYEVLQAFPLELAVLE